jgi:hypothetical protein
MWEDIKEGEMDVSWLRDALTTGTLMGVMDQSYDRHKAKSCSGAGWVLACRSSKKTLRRSFYKVSLAAGSYHGELLGLGAIHTLILAAAEYYQPERIPGKICCNNMSALNQASKVWTHIPSGIKHLDLQQVLHTHKCKVNMALTYSQVRAHQNALKPWSMLTLEVQLNVICDELANAAAQWYLSNASPTGRGIQLLPLEKVAIMIKGEKLTTDTGQEVWYALGQEEPRRFYTGAIVKKGSTNTGRLGWMQYKFDQVSWKSINATLKIKPDMFQILHAKQCIGICATCSQLAHTGQQVPKLPTGEGNKPTPELLPGPWTNPPVLRERQTPG